MPFNFKKTLPLLGLAASALFPNQTISNLPANSWYTVPNSHLYDVRPSGWTANVIIPWSGGALDTKRHRMIIWGGGHQDYSGNELYSFDINTLAWSRLTDPCANRVADQEVNPDGTPNSRHTYGSLAYLENADRFFGLGGSLYGIGFATCNRTWTFDFDNLKWTNHNPATHPNNGVGATCAYDPESKKLYYAMDWAFWSYDVGTNLWTKLDDQSYFYDHNSTIDTKRGLFMVIGGGKVIVYDIRNKNYKAQTWTTTGGDNFISGKPGVDYDPASDKIVGWGGGAIYALDPSTKAWTSSTPSGSAPTYVSQGMYGRWRYDSADNAFICVGPQSENVHFYKFTAGGGTTALSPSSAQAAAPPALKVFPNPYRGTGPLSAVASNGNLQGSLRLFDVSGKQVAATEFLQNGKAQLRGNGMHSLPAGIYMVEMRAAGKAVSRQPVAILK